MEKINSKYLFFIAKVMIIFSLILLLPTVSNASDECGSTFPPSSSDFSATLNSSNILYSKSDSAGSNDGWWGNNTDTYYINIAEAGEVIITVTGNHIRFSYDESGCPSKNDTPNSTTATYTYTSATDFNLKVYRSNGSSKNYTITISFTPSVSCNNMDVDNDKIQCPSACFTKVQDAIDAAVANDTISICEGTYTEDLKISTSGLHLISKSLDATKVILQSDIDDTIELSSVHDTTLEFLTVKQSEGKAAVLIKNNSTNTLVKNLLIISNDDGVRTEGDNGALEITSSTINTDDEGVELNGILTASLKLPT